MASGIYANYILKGYDSSTKIDVTSNTIKGALVTSSYTFDPDNHDFFNDITNEVTGTGYTAGGATLANKTWAVVGASNVVKFDADDLSWPSSSITSAGLAIYKDTGTSTTSPLMCFVDFGGNKVSDGGTFLVSFNASGIFTISY